MGRIEPLSLFSVPVFTGIVDGLVERRELLTRSIEDRRRCDAGVHASNEHAWHSTRDLHQSCDEDLRWLFGAVRALAGEMLASAGAGTGASPLVMLDAWAMMVDEGGWSTPHQHFPALWSGVVYVSAERSVGTAPRDKSGKLELLNPVPLPERFGQPTGLVIGPRDGLLVLFPGSLSHFVHPVRAGAPRVSVSFNLGPSAARVGS